ncbi:hypothetical protein CEK28_01775 [Xenophilus sp. AP218F]|nr:hypothetical protein CEK28_01775 [Xenophilus sp. AP218F]
MTLHAAIGRSSWGILSALQADGRLGGELLPLVEDLSIGPLADAEMLDPQLRAAWWNQLWWSEPWCPGQDEDWERHYWLSRKAQLRAQEARRGLVVWMGRNAGDRLQLAQLAAQWPASGRLAVIDVPPPPDWPWPEWSVAMRDEATLEGLQDRARVLDAAERRALAAEWAHWRERGQGLRRLIDGRIEELPLDAWDETLLAQVAAAGGSLDASAVYGAFLELAPLLPACLLSWRMAQLEQAGRLRLRAQAPRPPRLALAD